VFIWLSPLASTETGKNEKDDETDSKEARDDKENREVKSFRTYTNGHKWTSDTLRRSHSFLKIFLTGT